MKVIKSPINYNGNKTKIIEKLIDLFPSKISVLVDLFGGSGVVSLNANAEHHIYNEIIPYISQILEGIKSEEDIDVLVDKLKKRSNREQS
ncbi:MAG: DNA adenine methylase [Clostridium sp.]|uniref:DNA adenine methylase n=1 Tax=Clostridium sp. TaxID=1506 RepID=UPI003EE5A91D